MSVDGQVLPLGIAKKVAQRKIICVLCALSGEKKIINE